MTVKISQIADQIAIYDEKNNLLRSFEIKENLPRALEFLKQLNSLKTIDGTPVYETSMFSGISVWSFHQNAIFWNFLRDYVKYEKILKFLVENKIKEVIAGENIEHLKEYLRRNQIKIINDSLKSRKMRSFFVAPLMKIIAFLITFLALLKILITRTNVLIYTPDKFSKKYDCDFRFYPVYEYLRENKIPYIEIFHTLLNREFFKNSISRKRLAFYLEVFPFFSVEEKTVQKYDLSSFETHNQKCFQYLLKIIDGDSQNSVERVKMLSWVLKFTKIKTLLAMDDLRYINEVILASKLNNIKTYGFQHGFLCKYQTGWTNYQIPKELSIAFDKFFVWNEYWKRALLPYSTQYDENNTEIGGPLREPKIIDYKKNKLKIGKITDLNILIPYETFAPKKEVRDYIEILISRGVKIFFKPRPDISLRQQLKEYGLKGKKDLEIVGEINGEVLSRTDAVAGTYTTFLNEMLFYEKPLFIFDTSFYDFGYQLVEEKLGLLIKKDFTPSILLDYINNYQSKKNQAWPPAETNLRETLDKLNLKNLEFSK